MIHRRPGDDRFFEIFKSCVDKNPNSHIHFFGHGANNIDQIKEDLLVADKPNIIFSLDLSHHKTRQRIKKEVTEKQAELWWIGAEYDVFGSEAIKESWWGGEFFLQANEYINLPEIAKEPSNKSDLKTSQGSPARPKLSGRSMQSACPRLAFPTPLGVLNRARPSLAPRSLLATSPEKEKTPQSMRKGILEKKIEVV